MNPDPKLPKPIATCLRGINTRDVQAFESSFTPDALVRDIDREIRGLDAIGEWARNEIFAVNVTLEVMAAVERDGQTVVTVKVDGTFDRTGLPDPLVMEHSFVVAGERIASLTCRLAGGSR
jgi:hypothetical protein